MSIDLITIEILFFNNNYLYIFINHLIKDSYVYHRDSIIHSLSAVGIAIYIIGNRCRPLECDTRQLSFHLLYVIISCKWNCRSVAQYSINQSHSSGFSSSRRQFSLSKLNFIARALALRLRSAPGNRMGQYLRFFWFSKREQHA